MGPLRCIKASWRQPYPSLYTPSSRHAIVGPALDRREFQYSAILPATALSLRRSLGFLVCRRGALYPATDSSRNTPRTRRPLCSLSSRSPTSSHSSSVSPCSLPSALFFFASPIPVWKPNCLMRGCCAAPRARQHLRRSDYSSNPYRGSPSGIYFSVACAIRLLSHASKNSVPRSLPGLRGCVALQGQDRPRGRIPLVFGRVFDVRAGKTHSTSTRPIIPRDADATEPRYAQKGLGNSTPNPCYGI
ncbi:hypothetical protein C8Q79DRAFT_284720 [Trametes meyenii]|nr:hypothetical protein C8Q79DRAFT_284720 [Trametes meyenii]